MSRRDDNDKRTAQASPYTAAGLIAFPTTVDQHSGAAAFQGQAFPGQAFPGQPFPGQGIPGQGIPGQGMPGQGMPGTGAARELTLRELVDLHNATISGASNTENQLMSQQQIQAAVPGINQYNSSAAQTQTAMVPYTNAHLHNIGRDFEPSRDLHNHHAHNTKHLSQYHASGTHVRARSHPITHSHESTPHISPTHGNFFATSARPICDKCKHDHLHSCSHNIPGMQSAFPNHAMATTEHAHSTASAPYRSATDEFLHSQESLNNEYNKLLKSHRTTTAKSTKELANLIVQTAENTNKHTARLAGLVASKCEEATKSTAAQAHSNFESALNNSTKKLANLNVQNSRKIADLHLNSMEQLQASHDQRHDTLRRQLSDQHAENQHMREIHSLKSQAKMAKLLNNGTASESMPHNDTTGLRMQEMMHRTEIGRLRTEAKLDQLVAAHDMLKTTVNFPPNDKKENFVKVDPPFQKEPKRRFASQENCMEAIAIAATLTAYELWPEVDAPVGMIVKEKQHPWNTAVDWDTIKHIWAHWTPTDITNTRDRYNAIYDNPEAPKPYPHIPYVYTVFYACAQYAHIINYTNDSNIMPSVKPNFHVLQEQFNDALRAAVGDALAAQLLYIAKKMIGCCKIFKKHLIRDADCAAENSEVLVLINNMAKKFKSASQWLEHPELTELNPEGLGIAQYNKCMVLNYSNDRSVKIPQGRGHLVYDMQLVHKRCAEIVDKGHTLTMTLEKIVAQSQHTQIHHEAHHEHKHNWYNDRVQFGAGKYRENFTRGKFTTHVQTSHGSRHNGHGQHSQSGRTHAHTPKHMNEFYVDKSDTKPYKSSDESSKRYSRNLRKTPRIPTSLPSLPLVRGTPIDPSEAVTPRSQKRKLEEEAQRAAAGEQMSIDEEAKPPAVYSQYTRQNSNFFTDSNFMDADSVFDADF